MIIVVVALETVSENLEKGLDEVEAGGRFEITLITAQQKLA